MKLQRKCKIYNYTLLSLYILNIYILANIKIIRNITSIYNYCGYVATK